MRIVKGMTSLTSTASRLYSSARGPDQNYGFTSSMFGQGNFPEQSISEQLNRFVRLRSLGE